MEYQLSPQSGARVIQKSIIIKNHVGMSVHHGRVWTERVSGDRETRTDRDRQRCTETSNDNERKEGIAGIENLGRPRQDHILS